MKILITGFSGFVSQHFLTLLNGVEPGSQVLGIDKNKPGFSFSDYNNLHITFSSLDLMDARAVSEALVAFQPDHILHLASISSVALSWQQPAETFINNTQVFLQIAEQVRVNNIHCRIVSVGSSEIYAAVTASQLPLTETHELNPSSPYAVARMSQEMLSQLYVSGFGSDIIMTRSFNHIGPGQKAHFVIASFANQLVELSKISGPKKIITGDLSIIRDFSDVRDVVNAYYLILKKGKKGEVYNVCSGNGHSLEEILNKMAELLNIEIIRETDPNLLRPNENKAVIGSNKKIKDELGWEPSITLDHSLSDVIKYWQEQLALEGRPH